jgi:hypothetical protein
MTSNISCHLSRTLCLLLVYKFNFANSKYYIYSCQFKNVVSSFSEVISLLRYKYKYNFVLHTCQKNISKYMYIWDLIGLLFFCNFTFYYCIFENLHTSCSCLHNTYICIQIDHAKPFSKYMYLCFSYNKDYLLMLEHSNQYVFSLEMLYIPF